MEKPVIVFLVNGSASSAMGVRAQTFAELLASDFDIHTTHRETNKILAIPRFFWRLTRRRPQLCYVFDMGATVFVAAALYRLVTRCPMIIDTGDAIYELSRSTGKRGPIGMALTRLLEWAAFTVSDRVVVRSHPHQELLESRGISADVIADGVDLEQFRPLDEDALRRKYQLQGYSVVGVLGTLVWSERWKMCYGWELLEVIHLLRDRPVKGVIIGDGSGLAHLKARCESLGIMDRIVFLGRVPYDELPQLINLMDVCLSTQTNDIPGQVRTTGKLPIYLACGRYVLASRVGEAARILPEEMLLDYEGSKDVNYPARLAERVKAVLDHPQALNAYSVRRRIAQEHFDYRALARKLRLAIQTELSKPSRRGQSGISQTKKEEHPGAVVCVPKAPATRSAKQED